MCEETKAPPQSNMKFKSENDFVAVMEGTHTAPVEVAYFDGSHSQPMLMGPDGSWTNGDGISFGTYQIQKEA